MKIKSLALPVITSLLIFGTLSAYSEPLITPQQYPKNLGKHLITQIKLKCANSGGDCRKIAAEAANKECKEISTDKELVTTLGLTQESFLSNCRDGVIEGKEKLPTTEEQKKM